MHWLAWYPVMLLVAVAVIWDLRCRRIPNWLVVPFMVAGVTMSAVHSGWRGLAISCSGIALAAAVLGGFCSVGGMGMGDLKLFAAIGSWIGPGQLATALASAGIAGGIMALIVVAFSGELGRSLDNTGELIGSALRSGLRRHPELNMSNPKARKIPFAPAIAIGTLVSFFSLPG